MSTSAITDAFKAPVDDFGAKFVLVALADNADEDGYAFPKTKTLARKCGMSLATAYRKLNWLMEAGIVEKVPGFVTPRGNIVDAWRLHPSAAHSQPENDEASQRENGESHPENRVSQPAKDLSQPERQEPSGNQSVNTPDEPPDRFPVRVRKQDGDEKLLTLTYRYAKQRDEQPAVVESRQDLASWAIGYARQNTDGRMFDMYVLTVMREVYEAIAGEPLETAANKHLRRLINLAGPQSALRVMCEALAAGAGLDEEYENDPRAAIKYAVAIYNRERKGE